MKTIIRPMTKACVGCGAPFTRQEETNRQWDVTRRCSPCERANLKARLLARTVENENGCWIWQGATKNGYGQMSVRDHPTYTHRLAYELFVGPVPDGMEICHRCDVKRCNYPDHLFLGTQLDNIADMRSKGRGAKPPAHYGEDHPQARLTSEQVAEIRSLRAAGIHQRAIAARFGCSQSTVWRIAHSRVRKTG